MELTKLEKEILELVEEATGGFAEEAKYIYKHITKNGYDMKVARGVIGSLVKKNILEFDSDSEFIYHTSWDE